jgi:hypothetical protein
MGLTHYWERETELRPDPFRNAVTDMQRITASLPIKLAGRDGAGVPVFDADAVAFNGAAGSGCEPFEIHQTQFDRRGRKRFFQYVKTERTPYDLAVKVSLICLKNHLADEVKITSDAPDSEWSEARRLCSELLGYGAAFRLEG